MGADALPGDDAVPGDVWYYHLLIMNIIVQFSWEKAFIVECEWVPALIWLILRQDSGLGQI